MRIQSIITFFLGAVLMLPAISHANTFDAALVAKARSMLYGTSYEAELEALKARLPAAAVVATGVTVTGISTQSRADSGGTVREKVTRYFSDTPVMVAIAECESGMRQFGPDGTVLRGGYGGMMIGLFQLHETYHRSTALAQGLNIDTLAGNMAYAKQLYRQEGASPWLSSAECWNKKLPAAVEQIESGDGVPVFTKTLLYGAVDEEIRALQKLLNAEGYQVAASGPGAPGSETSIFGPLTRAALTKFQCEEDIACSGDSEYGMVGEKTRAALNTRVE